MNSSDEGYSSEEEVAAIEGPQEAVFGERVRPIFNEDVDDELYCQMIAYVEIDYRGRKACMHCFKTMLAANRLPGRWHHHVNSHQSLALDGFQNRPHCQECGVAVYIITTRTICGLCRP